MMPRNGKMIKEIGGVEHVGVLISAGFGAGWYSWNPKNTQCLFEPEIIHIVEAYRNKKMPQNIITEITTIAHRKWPDGYWGGAEGLKVIWVTVGTKFMIDEYDGSESIQTIVDVNWIEA